jgi:hypothetical protein
MRIRGVIAGGLVLVSGSIFWACGSTSFESSTDDDGGSGADGSAIDGSSDDGSASDGTIGIMTDGSARSDGSATSDGGEMIDASEKCAVPISAIQNQNDAGVVCPGAGNCGSLTTLTCCIDGVNAEGMCNSGCAPNYAAWSCEKTSDCAVVGGAKCCLTGDAGSLDLSSCPARIPAASMCESLGCGLGARLCAKTTECAGLPVGTVCRPLYATFGGIDDAGTMVGVCVAP